MRRTAMQEATMVGYKNVLFWRNRGRIGLYLPLDSPGARF
jgi:hypothetical protein